MSQKTWGGRFTGGTDNRVEAFTESISFDRRLYRHDILASQAHARMLAEVGLLTADEAAQIVAALDEIRAEIERGEFAFSIKLEDIHTHIERALIARLGDVGRKLHTGRSRNDQVVTDVKLLVRDAHRRHRPAFASTLQKALLVNAADRERDVVLPGYTHLQRAQPVLAAHYFLAYVEKYQRDRERLADCRKRVNVLPLGAAALAGTSLPIDRDSVRQQLGFDRRRRQQPRCFQRPRFPFGIRLLTYRSSPCTWRAGQRSGCYGQPRSSSFLVLPDAFCTGSSIMPHKKNPDVLELIRGKSARVAAALQQLILLVKGLPLAYNRDLQEDKEPLFDAHDTVDVSLELAAALIDETRLNRERIAARLEDGYLDATTLMELFIAKGVPMRAAHEAVGKLVRQCEQQHCRLADLSTASFDEVQAGLGNEVGKVLGVANALKAFRGVGSTAPAEVQRQLAQWQSRLRQ